MPRAFVIRPFNVKKDSAGNSIDFEKVRTTMGVAGTPADVRDRFGFDRLPGQCVGTTGVKRYSFSAVPRWILYCVSGERCEICSRTDEMQSGHVESECG